MIKVTYKRKGQKERTVPFNDKKLAKEDATHYVNVLKQHLKTDLEKVKIEECLSMAK